MKALRTSFYHHGSFMVFPLFFIDLNGSIPGFTIKISIVTSKSNLAGGGLKILIKNRNQVLHYSCKKISRSLKKKKK